ncbi:MAG: hypothetical protein F4X58_13680 [Chloroflexi bacterium]|nr:hypothetical protein [Chloroflexota bacterium]MYC02956.1 hypothetical protein [Chloroflexota bacterium]
MTVTSDALIAAQARYLSRTIRKAHDLAATVLSLREREIEDYVRKWELPPGPVTAETSAELDRSRILLAALARALGEIEQALAETKNEPGGAPRPPESPG